MPCWNLILDVRIECEKVPEGVKVVLILKFQELRRFSEHYNQHVRLDLGPAFTSHRELQWWNVKDPNMTLTTNSISRSSKVETL